MARHNTDLYFATIQEKPSSRTSVHLFSVCLQVLVAQRHHHHVVLGVGRSNVRTEKMIDFREFPTKDGKLKEAFWTLTSHVHDYRLLYILHD
jgi:hypothetical protein